MNEMVQATAAKNATPQIKKPQDIEAFLLIENPNEAYIFHEHPFGHELSWLEYDVISGRLDFIMDDGAVRNFGIPITQNIGLYLQNISMVCIAHKNGNRVLSELDIPLIVHRN